MLGWIISLGMLAAGIVHNNIAYVIGAGLFAIAGSIGFAPTTWLNNIKEIGKIISQTSSNDRDADNS